MMIMSKNSEIVNKRNKLSSVKRALLEKRLRGKTRIGPDSQSISIQPIPRDGELQLSFSQERVWFIHQLDPSNLAYNSQIALRFEGPLDILALERSLNEIIRRHEIYRTTFPVVDGRPVQVIHEPQSIHLPLINLEVLPEEEREIEYQRLFNTKLRQTFDLTQLPLVRWTLFRLNAQEHVFLHIEHHIIHDGWSVYLFLRELLELYKAFRLGEPSPLLELPIQFVDFAHWQRQWMQSEEAKRQLVYWRKRLADIPPALELPYDRLRPAVQRFRGNQLRMDIDTELWNFLKALSLREKKTPFMTMLAAFMTLLHRYTGQDDISIGSGIANRRWRETENLMGMIINNIVLRTDASGNPTFRELLNRVRQVTLESYQNQDMPFDKVVKTSGIERDLSYNPLFHVMFSFQDTPLPALDFPKLRVTQIRPITNGSAKFDLNLVVIPRSEQHVGLSLKAETDETLIIWEYNTDLFDDATINRMIEHYHMLLKGIVADPEHRLSELPLLKAAERHQLLVEWNHTRTNYPKDKCIHELFETQVKRRPDAVAVIYKDEQLTYRELNCRANQLAYYLRHLGVGPEVLVGVLLERSIEIIIALIGILKAGGAYVPLDTTYPKERLSFMLEDMNARVLLTKEHLLKNLPDSSVKLVSIDKDWETISAKRDNNPTHYTTTGNLAYVMYTSGSTGSPKGVSINHQSVVRLVKKNTYAHLSEKEIFLQFAPVSFDASTFEIWGCLLNGAKLVIFPDQLPSLEKLQRTIRNYKITTMWLTAGLFHQMVDDHIDSLLSVRQILAGGDVLSVSRVQKLHQNAEGCQLINGYGPTENTTFTCCYRLKESSQIISSVPIGRPIENTQVYILDRYQQPVPVGVPGELCIGGDGLARSYHNRPDLTAEKFIPNPFSDIPGERLYRTGDLARYLPDSNIEFLGRTDHQVKIRGFRIELGEIEVVLAGHPAVNTTVVIAREDQPGDKRLVAYVVPKVGKQLSVRNLRNFLKERLPEYMVPSGFLFLESLPLTPNGKVDRQVLPPPDKMRPEQKSTFVPPRTPIEKALTEIWANVIGLERVGIHDSFFELGGHSLLATQMISRLRQLFGIEFPLRSLFESPTVAEMAMAIAQMQAEQIEQTDFNRMINKLEQLSDEETDRLLSKRDGKE